MVKKRLPRCQRLDKHSNQQNVDKVQMKATGYEFLRECHAIGSGTQSDVWISFIAASLLKNALLTRFWV